jgi:hypothetical protein
MNLRTPHHADPDRLVAHILGEHRRGRPVAEIMNDPKICGHCTEEERRHLLERVEVIRAVAEDTHTARNG